MYRTHPCHVILTSKKQAKDVTSGKESFGPGGPYAAFAGHDATYNLAVMTLKKQSVDKFAARLDMGDDRTGSPIDSRYLNMIWVPMEWL